VKRPRKCVRGACKCVDRACMVDRIALIFYGRTCKGVWRAHMSVAEARKGGYREDSREHKKNTEILDIFIGRTAFLIKKRITHRVISISDQIKNIPRKIKRDFILHQRSRFFLMNANWFLQKCNLITER